MGLPRNVLGVPLHPLIVPFPLVLWLAATVLTITALWFGPQPWWSFSLGASALGVVLGITGIATGLTEFVHRTHVNTDVRLAARHGIRTSLAWLLFCGKLIMGLTLPPTPAVIGAGLAIDLIACTLLIQGVILGTQLIYSEDVRDRDL